ncbi:hypothetical protein IG631_23509 [Alternaria alternata]|nr:hypothetical protein IG631_23509 [Alternaria alternata]
MLLCTKSHFIPSLEKRLSGDEGPGDEKERLKTGEDMLQRIKDYATDASGRAPGCDVWYWHASRPVKLRRTTTSNTVASPTSPTAPRPGAIRAASTASALGPVKEEKGKFHQLVQGKGVKPGQRVVYVDGGWDLFSSGHIEFLRLVTSAEEEGAKERGWYTEEARKERIEKAGEDYGPVFLIAGIHDDEVINHWKGINYPIMNIFERGLCVLQCKVRTPLPRLGPPPLGSTKRLTCLKTQYIHSAIFGAPFSLSKAFLHTLPYNPESPLAAVYHGKTTFMPLAFDPYAVAKTLGLYTEIANHEFQNVNAAEIVSRIMKGRALYEERQRKKGEKGMTEEVEKIRQEMEREQRRREVEGQFGL